LPVIHGTGSTTAAARRWKSQLNENPELPAFASELPEAGHNELCSWERGHALAPLSAVFLEDAGQPGELRRRIELTADTAAGAGAPVHRVASRGRSGVERVMSLVLLGDLVSVYLAVLDGVDPTPVAAIDRLKSSLR
jgi:glucose/mannose-6-phosphate isomerase